MRVYITTTGLNYATDVDASPGDAALRAWKNISQGVPLEAGILQHTGDATEVRQTIFNRDHVITVREMPEQ